MPQYLQAPSNRILVGPSYVETVECEVGANATAAKMLPGRLVEYDAADGAVKEGASKSDVILGVLEVKVGGKVTDAYAVGDPCNVIPRGSGAFVILTLASGTAAVTPGDPLVCNGDGKAAKLGVGAMGAQGSVVAHAWTSADPSAADKTVIAQLSGAAEPAAAA